MKTISSRPEDDDKAILTFDFDELQLITAFMYNTRLGFGAKYKEAASRILRKMEGVFGDDFAEEASDAVEIEVNIVDRQSTILLTYSMDEVEFEV